MGKPFWCSADHRGTGAQEIPKGMDHTMDTRGTLTWTLGALLALTLAGCATRGEPPPGATAAASVPPAAAVEAVQPSPPRSSLTGSLWTAKNDSLFRDIKAHRIGDIVTIMVSEESEASKEATTSTSRAKELSGSGNFVGLGTSTKTILRPLNDTGYGFTFDNTFTGKGSTKKADSMTAYMTATVTDILPNGNLVIRGSRWTRVNDEMQQIILEGVIRPMDISRDNTILSQNIAEAKIFFVGKGPVTNHQKPGLLGQLLDVLLPF